MFMKLHYAKDGRELWIKAINVLYVEKAPAGPKGEIQLGSYVATSLIGPQGPTGYHVKEDPIEIVTTTADMIRGLVEEDNKAKASLLTSAQNISQR